MFKNKALLIVIPAVLIGAVASYLEYLFRKDLDRLVEQLNEPLPAVRQPELILPPLSDEDRAEFDAAMDAGDLSTAATILYTSMPRIK